MRWNPAHSSKCLSVCLILLATCLARHEVLRAEELLLFGGCGGVYLLAEPGELAVEIEKRDRNRRQRHTELRAILVGPDRRVVDEAAIPDDGKPRGSGVGPAQRARLSTRVERRGIYALNITVSQDRYGEDIVWGFRTNCRRFLVETSRGHRDERHREPIVLASPGRAATVCFLPRPGAISIELSDLPASSAAPEVFDAHGESVGTLRLEDDGGARGRFSVSSIRSATPWRLHLPSARATIHIDGVTRWKRDDPYRDLCYWTPDPASWFPFLENRWLLTPYSRKIYGTPGHLRQVSFRLQAGPREPKTVRLALEFPGSQWRARLSADRVALEPGENATVTVTCEVPAAGETATCHLRATLERTRELSTYSTVTVLAGEAPWAQPLVVPFQLEAYRHENEQLGYLPTVALENQRYFDLENRPFVSLGGSLAAAEAGGWTIHDLGSRSRALTTKIAFDRDNDLYVVADVSGTASLLCSDNGGETFSSHAIPGRAGTYDLEQFSGNNIPDGPPPFVRFTRTASDPELIWRRIHDLDLFVPRKSGKTVDMGEPIRVSTACIGLSAHSGIPSSVVSQQDKVHVAWGEATDPNERVPGVPTFVVTYDSTLGRLGEPALVGYGPPANDIHNSPSITMDSRGYLHVLIGTHGRPFQYVHSLAPNDAGGGWTDPVTAGASLNQTYIGLVCDPKDTLHAVYRLWRSGPPFPHSTHATLAYQRKPPDGPWGPPQILVVAPFSEYSVFYHRLTIDRRGQLFLSYDYWSTYWFYRLDHPGDRRALMASPDGGETWRLVGDRP